MVWLTDLELASKQKLPLIVLRLVINVIHYSIRCSGLCLVLKGWFLSLLFNEIFKKKLFYLSWISYYFSHCLIKMQKFNLIQGHHSCWPISCTHGPICWELNCLMRWNGKCFFLNCLFGLLWINLFYRCSFGVA